MDFYIDRSRIGLLGSKQRDEAFVGVALWAWQKLALLAMAMPTRSRPQGQGHAHKGLDPFGTQKANSRSIDVKNPKKNIDF